MKFQNCSFNGLKDTVGTKSVPTHVPHSWGIMMGWSSRCNIPSFVKIGLPILEKKIFDGFLPYMGVAAILVM